MSVILERVCVYVVCQLSGESFGFAHPFRNGPINVAPLIAGRSFRVSKIGGSGLMRKTPPR